VRLHTGSEAADMAKSITAKAFTTGKDVMFGAGQYSPDSAAGKKLMGHELAHVVQQVPDVSNRSVLHNITSNKSINCASSIKDSPSVGSISTENACGFSETGCNTEIICQAIKEE
jgi:hypothetical protein